MRIFVTGATGFIGSAIVSDLIAAGHRVLGLTRSDAGAATLKSAGADVQFGSLEQLDTVRQGATLADAVIHTAFNRDFSRFKASCEADRAVIEALGSALQRSGKRLVVTSGTSVANIVPGEPATENTPAPSSAMVPRAASEEAATSARKLGVDVCVIRLPQVHNTEKQGLISYMVPMIRRSGVSAYVGEGLNRCSAVHVSDAARLYRFALEKGEPGATYHAVAEDGVPFREIAAVIGRSLNLQTISVAPEDAAAYFGGFAMFAGRDGSASAVVTRERLGWCPSGPGLLADLEQMTCTQAK